MEAPGGGWIVASDGAMLLHLRDFFIALRLRTPCAMILALVAAAPIAPAALSLSHRG